MARTRSQVATRSATAAVTRTARLRSVLRGNLHAMALPDRAATPSDPAVSTEEADRERKHEGRLGDYLRVHGLISEHDLAAALLEQHRRIGQGNPIALGDLLVEQGLLTTHDLVTALMLQQLDRLQERAIDTPPPLGELLVQAGLITAEQLATALTVQTEARQRGELLRLGQILIELGALSPPDLATVLARQRRVRY